MTRSMLCAVGLFLGLLIAPGARAYPTGKVVELTEANFDAEVRPFPTSRCCPAAGDDRAEWPADLACPSPFVRPSPTVPNAFPPPSHTQVAKGPTLIDVYADWCGRE